MKKLVVIISIGIMSCGPSQKNKISEQGQVSGNNNQPALPVCIQNKIDSFKTAEKHLQPQKLVQYEYKGRTVYYVATHCCDFFNELYDSECKLMGYPDGGFTGKGDGRFPDFFKEATKEKLIWENKAK